MNRLHKYTGPAYIAFSEYLKKPDVKQLLYNLQQLKQYICDREEDLKINKPMFFRFTDTPGCISMFDLDNVLLGNRGQQEKEYLIKTLKLSVIQKNLIINFQ